MRRGKAKRGVATAATAAKAVAAPVVRTGEARRGAMATAATRWRRRSRRRRRWRRRRRRAAISSVRWTDAPAFQSSTELKKTHKPTRCTGYGKNPNRKNSDLREESFFDLRYLLVLKSPHAIKFFHFAHKPRATKTLHSVRFFTTVRLLREHTFCPTHDPVLPCHVRRAAAAHTLSALSRPQHSPRNQSATP